MSESFFIESIIRESSCRVRDIMLASLPQPEECCHQFSPRFERKMRLLFRRAHHKFSISRMIRNVAASIALIIIVVSIWVATDEAAYATFSSWVKELYHDTAIYHFFTKEHKKALPRYTFGWLPAGFDDIETLSDSDFHLSMASDGNGNIVILEYQFAVENSNLTISGNNLLSKDVTVHGREACLYWDSEEDSPIALVWIEDGLVFQINSNLSSSTIIKIAENIRTTPGNEVDAS